MRVIEWHNLIKSLENAFNGERLDNPKKINKQQHQHHQQQQQHKNLEEQFKTTFIRTHKQTHTGREREESLKEEEENTFRISLTLDRV